MAFFTLTEVREAAARATGTRLDESQTVIASRTEAFFEEKAIIEARRLAVKHFDIFLSHAYRDKVIVAGLYSMLSSTGFTVYVDWIHDRHRLDRNKVTADNAAILRERMHQCDALFYTTTEKHTDSKWMPWECGYFDGFDSKNIEMKIQAGHVAILPVLESVELQFPGQEYIGLYPVAQKGSLPKRNVNVHNQNELNRYLHFEQRNQPVYYSRVFDFS